jgi:LEA14-like dessication related protein
MTTQAKTGQEDPMKFLARTKIPVTAARLLGAITLALLLEGCSLLQADLQPPTVQLVSIVPESTTIASLSLRCRLRLDNPNTVDLPIKGGELTLLLANRNAAHGRLADDITLPANASAEVDAIVSIDVMSAIGIIARIMGDPDAALRYDIDGYVDVGVTRLGRIYFEESGEISAGSLSGRTQAGL